MKKKLIVFDLDGTLLTSENEVTQESKEAIWHCKEKGFQIAYITGRGTIKTRKFVQELPCDAYACNNGSQIFCEEKLIQTNCMDFKIGKEILQNECKDKEFYVVMEPLKYLNYDDEKIDNKDYFKNDIEHLPNCPIDMISVKNRDGIHLEKYSEIQTKRSGKSGIMINHKNATKGNALKVILNYFQIQKENCIVFGDDFSDIEMFQNSGTSVAMGNAIPELKQIATYVTEDNNHNGIANFINQFIIQ